MAQTWINIKDVPDVIDAVIGSENEGLEKMTEMQHIVVESDSGEENDELGDDVEIEQHKVTPIDEVISALDCLKQFIEQNELPD